jgi:hypothetical protein
MSKSLSYLLTFVMSLALFEVSAQDISKYKFLAYGALPAWTGVAVDWSTTSKCTFMTLKKPVVTPNL